MCECVFITEVDGCDQGVPLEVTTILSSQMQSNVRQTNQSSLYSRLKFCILASTLGRKDLVENLTLGG